MTHQAELVIDARATLAEGPSWDENKQVLYWVDIPGNQVHIFDPVQKLDRVIDVGQYVGAVVPDKKGNLVLAMHHGFYTYDVRTEQLQAIVDPETDLPRNRFNDGKCDPVGRFWAGTMSLDGEAQAGALYCLDTDLSTRVVIRHVTCSNGITWSPDYKTMYFIDTPTKQVVAYDFELNTGHLSNPNVVVTFPEDGSAGVPDGMTSDTEGMLWIAHWGGAQVSRWDPETGVQIDSVSVPASRVTSCVFAGEGLEELYITTAREGLSERDLKKQPHAGGVFRVKPGVKGLPTYSFG